MQASTDLYMSGLAQNCSPQMCLNLEVSWWSMTKLTCRSMGVLLQNEAISILKTVYTAENLGRPLKIQYLTTLFLKGFGLLFQISYGTT